MLVVALALAGIPLGSESSAADTPAVETLRKEVSGKGYLVASIKQTVWGSRTMYCR